MSDFKTGGVPAPDYDSDDINYVYKKSEFTEDIFEYAIPPEHLREQLGEPRWIMITSQDFSGGS